MNTKIPYTITKEELARIESWLVKKCDSLSEKIDDESDKNPSEYSEAKLSRGIFHLLLILLQEKKNQIDNHYHSPWLPHHHPYYPPYYTSTHIGPPAYPNYTYSDNTSNETICPTCKAHNPANTHCIHRAQFGLSSNTPGKI